MNYVPSPVYTAPPASYVPPPVYAAQPMSYAPPPVSYAPPPVYSAPLSPLPANYGSAAVYAAPPSSSWALPTTYGTYSDPSRGSYGATLPRSARTPISLRDEDLQPRVVPVEGRQSPQPLREPRRSISAPVSYGCGSYDYDYDYDPVMRTSRGIDRSYASVPRTPDALWRDPLSMSPQAVAGTGLASLDPRERLGIDAPRSPWSPGGRLLPEGPRLASRAIRPMVASRSPLSVGYADVLGPPQRYGSGGERVVAVF